MRLPPRKERRAYTLQRAKVILKDMGWPRRYLHDLWHQLMRSYPHEKFSSPTGKKERNPDPPVPLVVTVNEEPGWFARFKSWLRQLFRRLRLSKA